MVTSRFAVISVEVPNHFRPCWPLMTLRMCVLVEWLDSFTAKCHPAGISLLYILHPGLAHSFIDSPRHVLYTIWCSLPPILFNELQKNGRFVLNFKHLVTRIFLNVALYTICASKLDDFGGVQHQTEKLRVGVVRIGDPFDWNCFRSVVK